MPVTANLSSAAVEVQPGQEARIPLLVRNTGTIVDQFGFEPLGPGKDWIAFVPETVSLFPGAEETIQVCFRPPRGAAIAAGEMPFAVKVVPRDAPTETVVEEGSVTVAAVAEMAVELIPKTARGRRSAKFDMALDQTGNVAVNGVLAGLDEANELLFSFRPPGIRVGPGEAGFSSVRVRAKRGHLWGPPRMHPFRVLADTGSGPALAAEGTYIQDATIPGWVPMAGAALAMLALLGVGLWFLVGKPVVRSTAKQAAHKEVKKEVADQVAAQVKGALAAGSPVAAPPGGPTTPGGPTVATPPTAPPKPLPVVSGLPPGPVVDGRLTLNGGGTASYTVPAGKNLQITDMILENSKADTGTVSISRSGSPLLVLSLDNFRDLDYHFVSPLVLDSGQQLQLSATCTSADCSPAIYWVGYTLSGTPGA